MPQSVIETVNQMGKNVRNTTGIIFMDRKKCIMDGPEDEHEFNLENQLEKGIYPKISDMKADLPGIDLQHDTDEAYNKDDMNDLAEQSADNADELSIVEIMQKRWMNSTLWRPSHDANDVKDVTEPKNEIASQQEDQNRETVEKEDTICRKYPKRLLRGDYWYSSHTCS